MKSTLIAVLALALLAPTEAKHHRHRHGHRHHAPQSFAMTQGIDEKELMEGAHWRKSWPEGNHDNGDNDEDVMNLKAIPRKLKHKVDTTVTYPEAILDGDIVDSQRHLADTEEKLKQTFEKEGW